MIQEHKTYMSSFRANVKYIIFSIITISLFFSGLEAAYRIKVFVSTKNAGWLYYGLDAWKIRAGNIKVASKGAAVKSGSLHNPKGLKEIWCFGGSNVVCIEVDKQRSWPILLSGYINKDLGREAVSSENFGVSGSICRHNLNKLVELLSSDDRRPYIVIFYQGINDTININGLIKQKNNILAPNIFYILDKKLMQTSVLYLSLKEKSYKFVKKNMSKAHSGAKAGARDFRDDVEGVITTCRTAGSRIILCAEPVSREYLEKQGFVGYYNDVVETMRQVASSRGVTFIDVNKQIYEFDPNFAAYFTDGVHVNAKGNEVIALFLKKVVMALGETD